MPRQSLNRTNVPHALESALKQLGARIATARTRRQLRQEDLARKAGIHRLTLQKVEQGNPTTGIAAYFAALWAMGLEAEFADIARPERDEEGKTLERAREPKRVRESGALDADF